MAEVGVVIEAVRDVERLLDANVALEQWAEIVIPMLRNAGNGEAADFGLDRIDQAQRARTMRLSTSEAVYVLATILHQRESATKQQRCGPMSRGCRMRHRMDATSVLSSLTALPAPEAISAGTHEPAVDDFGNQYLARIEAEPDR